MISESIKQTVYHHLLTHSRQNPIKAADLAALVGITLRDINEVVRIMRKSGVMVGAEKRKPYGYYIPGSAEEAKECIRGFRSEMFDMIRTYQRQRKEYWRYVNSQQSKDLFELNSVGQFELII